MTGTLWRILPGTLCWKFGIEKHLVEINTFESRENLRDGMPAWAATDAGINVEFAFSKEALTQIVPVIAPQLQSAPVDMGRD